MRRHHHNGFKIIFLSRIVMDVLEYEITPVLESWQKLVEGTRAHIN